MDVDEFFMQLFEQLETALKASCLPELPAPPLDPVLPPYTPPSTPSYPLSLYLSL